MLIPPKPIAEAPARRGRSPGQGDGSSSTRSSVGVVRSIGWGFWQAATGGRIPERTAITLLVSAAIPAAALVATLATPRNDTFEARLVGADGKKIQRLDIGTGDEANAFKRALDIAQFTVAAVESKPGKRNPSPPFTTSTLQQEASRKLGFAPAHTMRLAQRLYEGIDIGGETVGLITYMRTDGVDMAPEAITSIRARSSAATTASTTCRTRRASTRTNRRTRRKPTKRSARPMCAPPARCRASSSMPIRRRLYELIWMRTIASQMESAEIERTTVDIAAKVGGRALSTCAPPAPVIKFDGFLTLYQEGQDDAQDDEELQAACPR